ncbi:MULTISPECIES: hypothetical protein, partial [unclassified Salmonella]|uniref:hypothetical protein n=1 Tax=Salmonella sp. NW663 TaxID=2948180 RepID=UPI003F4243C5
PERPKGADCKSAVTDFEGSNPSPTTIFGRAMAQPETISSLTGSNKESFSRYSVQNENQVAEFQDAGIV